MTTEKREREDDTATAPAAKRPRRLFVVQRMATVVDFARTVSEPLVLPGRSAPHMFSPDIYTVLWQILLAHADPTHAEYFKSVTFTGVESAAWPGVRQSRRYNMTPEAQAAFTAAAAEFDVTVSPGRVQLNLRIPSRAAMLAAEKHSPGYNLMHTVLGGNAETYETVVAEWWKFLERYEELLSA